MDFASAGCFACPERHSKADVIAADIVEPPVINFDGPPLPRRRSFQLIQLVVDILPAIENDVIAELLQELAIALAAAEDAITDERAKRQSALSIAHDRHVALVRCREARRL